MACHDDGWHTICGPSCRSPSALNMRPAVLQQPAAVHTSQNQVVHVDFSCCLGCISSCSTATWCHPPTYQAAFVALCVPVCDIGRDVEEHGQGLASHSLSCLPEVAAAPLTCLGQELIHQPYAYVVTPGATQRIKRQADTQRVLREFEKPQARCWQPCCLGATEYPCLMVSEG